MLSCCQNRLYAIWEYMLSGNYPIVLAVAEMHFTNVWRGANTNQLLKVCPISNKDASAGKGNLFEGEWPLRMKWFFLLVSVLLNVQSHSL